MLWNKEQQFDDNAKIRENCPEGEDKESPEEQWITYQIALDINPETTSSQFVRNKKNVMLY